MHIRHGFDTLDQLIADADDVVEALELLAGICAEHAIEPRTASNVLHPDAGFNGVACYGSDPAAVPAIDTKWDRYARGIEHLADIYRR